MGIVELKANYYRLEDKWNDFAKLTGKTQLRHIPVKGFPKTNYSMMRTDYNSVKALCTKHKLT